MEVTTSGDAALNTSANDRDLAITPDGARIIYRGQNRLLVRALDQLEPVEVASLNTPRNPFVSLDGQWVGFFDGTAIRKVAITGGPPVTLTALDAPPRGATWGEDGTIVYSTTSPTGLQRVSADGGDPTVLTEPDREAGEVDHLWPEFLPGGQAVLFTIMAGNLGNAQIAVLDLETNTQTVLLRGGSHAHYVPTGHLVYGVEGTLRAVAFDLASLTTVGTPVPVLEQVLMQPEGAVQAAVAANGTLAYLPGGFFGAQQSLAWVDRDGNVEPFAEGFGYQHPRVSPDRTRVAVSMLDANGGRDIYIYDLDRGTPTRLTFDPSSEDYPAWTADGEMVVFRSAREGGGIFDRRADGTGSVQPLLTGSPSAVPFDLSQDGMLLFGDIAPGTRDDLNALSMDAGSSPAPLLQTQFDEEHAALSPDGRWLAYTTDEAGQEDIYVRPFPNVDDAKYRISTEGAREPLWGPGGRELFFRGADGAIMTVSIETEPALSAGTPRVFVPGGARFGGGGGVQYDIAPDGQSLLVIAVRGGVEDALPLANIIVVQNWVEELKRLVPVD